MCVFVSDLFLIGFFKLLHSVQVGLDTRIQSTFSNILILEQDVNRKSITFQNSLIKNSPIIYETKYIGVFGRKSVIWAAHGGSGQRQTAQ